MDMNGWQLTWTSERSIWASRPDGVIDSLVTSRLAACISSRRSDIIRAVAPTGSGVLIELDVLQGVIGDLCAAVSEVIESFEHQRGSFVAAEASPAREIMIPVCYDERFAPDLKRVAEELCYHTEQIVELHTTRTYRVETVGFMPGFGYLGSLDDSLRLPRREAPRARVPAGSVAIAEDMTAVYPHQSPGGWHILGRTPKLLFDPARQEPAVLRVGDSVRFRQITLDEYNDCTRTQRESDP